MFFFIGIDENDIFNTLLCSVYHNQLIENTILQPHWAGRSTRGAAQFNGKAIDEMLCKKQFENLIDDVKAKDFLKKLLER